jgi:multidrug resistance efflux pump
LAGVQRSWVPAFVFGLRVWAAVCLALYVAFVLELDDAYWAGVSAAIVFLPSLGASLRGTTKSPGGDVPSLVPRARDNTAFHIRLVPILITLGTVALAVLLVYATWQVYVGAPWTRDGTVRVYVVTMAPEVVGRIVELPVGDNRFVHKGDLLMVIDATDYEIGVRQGQAALQQAKVEWQNKQAESNRRQKLSNLAVTDEEQQTFASSALAAQAAYQRAVANLDHARVNLDRTRITSPVNGYVTNLLTQLGDYATVGQRIISVVDTDSFWVDGYFEETNLAEIHDGDPATVKLMGYSQVVDGHVGSVARAINVPNAQPDLAGLASVNPIFTWVRLAQRVPVRIHIDQVPDGVRLVAGMTPPCRLTHNQSPQKGESRRSIV